MSESKPVHFFVHVPKCAGRTVEVHLERHLGPKFLNLRRKRGLHRHLSRHIYRLPRRFDAASIDAVSGHALGASLAARFSGRPVLESVLLREPVSMLVSFYNYRMAVFAEQGWPVVGFERFYRGRHLNPLSSFLLANYMELPWSRLLRMSATEKFDRLSARLEDFWFVGDYRQCDRLLARAGEDMDIPRAAQRVNVQETKLLTAETLPEAMKQRIVEDCALDQAIHDAWAHRGFRENAPQAVAPPPGGGRMRVLAHEAARQVENARLAAMRKRLGRRKPLPVIHD